MKGEILSDLELFGISTVLGQFQACFLVRCVENYCRAGPSTRFFRVMRCRGLSIIINGIRR